MFSKTITINWVDRKGRERDCDVDVKFEIRPGGYQDAEDEIRITSSRLVSECDLDQWDLDEMIYEALEDHVRENYELYMEE